MNCNINEGFFRGDDLIDVITVDLKNNEEKTITKAELQVGVLTIVNDNPVFPYKVSILRDKSVKLECNSPVYLRVYYLSDDGTETYRQTCLGTLNLKVNPQVVQDVQPVQISTEAQND